MHNLGQIADIENYIIHSLELNIFTAIQSLTTAVLVQGSNSPRYICLSEPTDMMMGSTLWKSMSLTEPRWPGSLYTSFLKQISTFIRIGIIEEIIILCLIFHNVFYT